MILKLLKWVASGKPYFLIQGYEGSPYLLRILLWGCMHGDERDNGRTSKFSVYLHHFYRHDLDKELHNHPWNFSISIILKGSYEEERFKKGKVIKRVLHPFSINIFRKNDFHRITKLNGEVWTFFIAGSKTQDWGFLDPNTNEYMTHQEFFKKRLEQVNEKTNKIPA